MAKQTQSKLHTMDIVGIGLGFFSYLLVIQFVVQSPLEIWEKFGLLALFTFLAGMLILSIDWNEYRW